MNRDPLKVLEYLALGKPTLTIDTPRMRALFRDGEEAVLYAPEDAASLGAALAGLLADPARAARIGAAGRALVEARHSWDQHAEELGEVFEEARSARRR
jgi:glycosyltransferase involved in cell wall biosynthesis